MKCHAMGQDSVHGAYGGCIITKPVLDSNVERKYAKKWFCFAGLFFCYINNDFANILAKINVEVIHWLVVTFSEDRHHLILRAVNVP